MNKANHNGCCEQIPLGDLRSVTSAPLLRTHQELDRAVDRCYRPEPFPSDRHRVEYLFALYENLAAPPVASTKPARRGRRLRVVP